MPASINWSDYSFPVKSHVVLPEKCNFNIDALPGRSTLVLFPLYVVGNIDCNRFPHYLADYEFFTRIKKRGLNICITYETSITAYIEETGIIGTSTTASFGVVWSELFSRRSMNNVMDHILFIILIAVNYQGQLLLNSFLRIISQIIYRTPLRILSISSSFLLSLLGSAYFIFII